MSRFFGIFLVVTIFVANWIFSMKLLVHRNSIQSLVKEYGHTNEDFSNFLICPRINEKSFQGIFEADLVLVSKSKVIDGIVYQIISEIIPLREGAFTFHQVGEPIGDGIELRLLSEIPEGAIHYSWDPSPHDTFTDLYSPTTEQRKNGAPSLDELIFQIRSAAETR